MKPTPADVFGTNATSSGSALSNRPARARTSAMALIPPMKRLHAVDRQVVRVFLDRLDASATARARPRHDRETPRSSSSETARAIAASPFKQFPSLLCELQAENRTQPNIGPVAFRTGANRGNGGDPLPFFLCSLCCLLFTCYLALPTCLKTKLPPMTVLELAITRGSVQNTNLLPPLRRPPH